MNLADTIAELEKLEAQATPGPWDGIISTGELRCPFGDTYVPLDQENLAFIAAMRNALPQLLEAAKTVVWARQVIECSAEYTKETVEKQRDAWMIEAGRYSRDAYIWKRSYQNASDNRDELEAKAAEMTDMIVGLRSYVDKCEAERDEWKARTLEFAAEILCDTKCLYLYQDKASDPGDWYRQQHHPRCLIPKARKLLEENTNEDDNTASGS